MGGVSARSDVWYRFLVGRANKENCTYHSCSAPQIALAQRRHAAKGERKRECHHEAREDHEGREEAGVGKLGLLSGAARGSEGHPPTPTTLAAPAAGFAPSEEGDGTLPCSAAGAPAGPSSCEDTKAEVVVAVAWRVVVPVGGPAVPRVVVPASAAYHAVRTSGQSPNSWMVRSRKAREAPRRTKARSGSTCRANSA